MAKQVLEKAVSTSLQKPTDKLGWDYSDLLTFYGGTE
jgi:hypothetical protein